MPRTERDRELARRRTRKIKLDKLVEKFLKTSSQADKQVIAAKVRRISPMYNLEARVAVLQEAKTAAKAAKTAKAVAKKK